MASMTDAAASWHAASITGLIPGARHSRETAEVTVEADTYQITVDHAITITAPPHYQPGHQAA
jgi:hypothetical protein